jgi:hypothetical protein
MLNNLSNLSPEILVNKFKNGEVSKIGGLSIWGDEIGKPGDNIYSLFDLVYTRQTNILKFCFLNNTEVNIFHPEQITLVENSVRVNNAQKIEWNHREKSIAYEKIAGLLTCVVIKGNHNGKISDKEAAFLYYTWQ